MLIITLPFFVLTFDFLLVSPFHELGHILAAYTLRIHIVKIGWSQVEYVPSPHWYANVIAGLAGGLFASFVLVVYYITFSRGFKSLINRAERRKLKVMLVRARLIFRVTIIADLLSQLILGIMEGTYPSLYRITPTNISIAFMLLLILSQYHLLFINQK